MMPVMPLVPIAFGADVIGRHGNQKQTNNAQCTFFHHFFLLFTVVGDAIPEDLNRVLKNLSKSNKKLNMLTINV
jgi:hypothetical protein